MDDLQEELFDICVLLLFAAERQCTKRKLHEALNNGLSSTFFDDPMLIIKMQEFLAEQTVKVRLERSLKRATN